MCKSECVFGDFCYFLHFSMLFLVKMSILLFCFWRKHLPTVTVTIKWCHLASVLCRKVSLCGEFHFQLWLLTWTFFWQTFSPQFFYRCKKNALKFIRIRLLFWLCVCNVLHTADATLESISIEWAIFCFLFLIDLLWCQLKHFERIPFSTLMFRDSSKLPWFFFWSEMIRIFLE